MTSLNSPRSEIRIKKRDSVIMQDNAYILGVRNTVFGNGLAVYGSNCSVTGNNNYVIGDHMIVHGNNNEVEGVANRVEGNRNLCNCDESVIMGNKNKVSGNHNFAPGAKSIPVTITIDAQSAEDEDKAFKSKIEFRFRHLFETCKICYASTHLVVFYPCMHLCVCLHCFESDEDNDRETCPLCGSKVRDYRPPAFPKFILEERKKNKIFC